MIRRHLRLLRLLLAAFDATAALVVIGVISALRFGGAWQDWWVGLFADPLLPAALVSLGWVLVLWSQGLYHLRSHWSFASQVKAVARAAALFALLTFAGLFVFKLPDVSRLFLLALVPALAITALSIRAWTQVMLTGLRRRGRNSRFVVIVGSGPTALRFARELAEHSALGLKIVGYVNGEANKPSMAWPYLGPVENLADVLHKHVVDEIAVCLDLAEWEVVNEIVELAKAEGKVARIPLATTIAGGPGTHIEDLGGLPVLSVTQGPDRELALAAKRALDVLVAGTVLIATLPLMALVALALFMDDGKPVLFSQQRVGLHGRRFRLLKFRTMVSGAEEKLHEVKGLNEITGPAFKITDDPRTTRVGRMLRRVSLDELPQLWNVIRGDMSLVGPRPPLPSEVKDYTPWHRRRLSMKPGITGLWQVDGHRETHFDLWVQRDLEYIDRWSLWLDAKIALRTIPRIIRADGR